MMFIALLDGCRYGDQNTWNTIPVSGQKITLGKQITEHWIIEQKQTEQNSKETKKIQRTDEQQQKTGNEYE
jgi:hypothetical protein